MTTGGEVVADEEAHAPVGVQGEDVPCRAYPGCIRYWFVVYWFAPPRINVSKNSVERSWIVNNVCEYFVECR